MLSDFITFMSVLMLFIACCFLCSILYRFSATLNDRTIRHAGHLFYKMICKSGFMVLIVIVITYAICKSEISSKSATSSNGPGSSSLSIESPTK